MDNGIRFMIHKAGTPRIGRNGHGGIMPAGLWWRDTRRGCGQWTSKELATVYPTNRGSLPDTGEWVEIYVNIPADITAGD